MAVEVRYLVIRDGKEVGMYTTKKEADAHDKMLDIADNLFLYIKQMPHMELKEDLIEELSIHLSQNREEVIRILRGAPLDKARENAPPVKAATPQPAAEKAAPKPAKTGKAARSPRS